MSYEKDRDIAAHYFFTGNTGPQARAFCNGADWSHQRDQKIIEDLRKECESVRNHNLNMRMYIGDLLSVLRAAEEMSKFVCEEFSRHEYETQDTSKCSFDCMRDGMMASFNGQLRDLIEEVKQK